MQIDIASQPELARDAHGTMIVAHLSEAPDAFWLSFFRPNIPTSHVQVRGNRLHVRIDPAETQSVVPLLEELQRSIEAANAAVRAQEEERRLRAQRLAEVKSELAEWWDRRVSSG